MDRERRLLLRAGRQVKLSPLALRLLELLIEDRPRALSRTELHDRLWSDCVVTDNSLTNLIAQVRRALGEGAAAPRYVRTVHTFGYSFDGEVREQVLRALASTRLTCRLHYDDRETLLSRGVSMIGRAPGSEVWIHDPNVSRRHAQIAIDEERVVLEDLGSHNGTFLRGERIFAPALLRDGDEIRIGPAVLRVEFATSDESTQTSCDVEPELDDSG